MAPTSFRFDRNVLRALRERTEEFYWRDTRPLSFLFPSSSATNVIPLVGLGMNRIWDEQGSYYAPHVCACVDFFMDHEDGSILCIVRFEVKGQTEFISFEHRIATESHGHADIIAFAAIARGYLRDSQTQSWIESNRVELGLNTVRLMLPSFSPPVWIPG